MVNPFCMTNSIKKEINILGEKIYLKANYIFYLFVLSAIVSYIYALSGFYNGDYIGNERSISVVILTILLLVYLLPYYLLWVVYRRFKFSNSVKVAPISVNMMFIFLVVYFFYTLVISGVFGVGKAEADVYTAPAMVKLVIQLTNRFSYGYFSLFVLLISRNIYLDLFIIFMTTTISIVNSSIGSFLFIGLVYTVKYNELILNFLKKRFIYIVFLTFFIPSVVSQLFSVRSRLRGADFVEMNNYDLIFGKLAGRLSSFSNFAVLAEQLPFFIVISDSVDDLYFQKQALKALMGVGEDPRENRPEYFMKAAFNQEGSVDPNSAFMISIPGNLLFSLIKSPVLFILNLLNYILYVYVIFFLVKFINVTNGFDFAFLITIYPVTSGVSNEFVTIITSLFFILVLKYFGKSYVIR